MRIFLTILSIAVLTGTAKATGIEFRDLTFKEALEASASEGKPIFMDCYAVWCGPCKWMSANIFTLDEIGDYYNENFVCVKFDMEKGEGREIAREYAVQAYPTLLYIDGNGDLLNVQVGAPQEPSEYIKTGEVALDPERNMPYLQANKADNFSNPEFMGKYFNTFGASGRLEKGELEKYLNQFEVQEWTSDANWEIIERNVRSYDSEVFQTVLENQKLFEKERGEEASQFLKVVTYNHLRMLYSYSKKNDDIYFEEQKNIILDPEKYSDAAEVGFMVDLMIFEKEGKWDEYCASCEEGVKDYYWDNPFQLNRIAWNVFENSDNPKNLEMALEWAERAVNLDSKQHYILDTYANLLLVNGMAEKALKMEKKALELARKKGEDTKAYEELIGKIEAQMKS